MRDFIKNTKGAVTVFVTLLLIPAILVSGTAVDLARIHTARSIIQDANQLAANSVLSQYNALLKDLYGLFGVAEDDPILGRLLDEYISVSIFGESGQDKTLGTLQLFYGSNISSSEPLFSEGKNLKNEDVLQRQIEEYMKFRGPVIIVKDMMELLGSSTFKEDSGVINDKLEVESAIAEMYEKYKELYDIITAANKCDQVSGGIVGGTVGTVSSSLDLIREQFISLKNCYEAWENEENQSIKNDHEARYRAILANIKSRTAGGAVGSRWNNGRFTSTTYPQGLIRTIENAKNHAQQFKPRFDDVVSIARQIDNMSSDLARKINDLEYRINSGNCNDELKSALTEKTGDPAKSLIERYRDILKWDNLESLATVFQEGGYSYIDDIMTPVLDDIKYRNMNNPSRPSLTLSQLENIQTSRSIGLSSSILAEDSLAAALGSYTKANITYNIPPGFKKFSDCSEGHKAFFDELFMMMNQPSTSPVKLYDGQSEASGSDAEAKQRNMINSLIDLVDTAYSGLKNEPLGAMYVDNNDASDTESFKMRDVPKIISQASSEPVASVISDPLGSITKAADYLLLLSYCTSAFSNYTTARPDNTNFPKSLTGVPLSPQVNYFFQSEWEYLYNGSKNASNNLSAVTRLIFVVRLICNYITVFSVSEVTGIITSIRTAFAWNPPLGLILGELARAAFVAAESAVDVASLRSGNKVPLIKSGKSGEWRCSPGGIAKVMSDMAADTLDTNNDSNDKGLTYSNYMVFLFIGKAIIGSDASFDLTKRTADLIEWNIINYESQSFSDEGKFAGALSAANRFKLVDMKTDFSITTNVDMRMLFLSMVFAQNFSGSRGIGIPSAMPVAVTDHRGY